jgi:hypothetical protein
MIRRPGDLDQTLLTKPDANGLYWKDGKIYFHTSPWFYALMIPAMLGTIALIVSTSAAALLVVLR